MEEQGKSGDQKSLKLPYVYLLQEDERIPHLVCGYPDHSREGREAAPYSSFFQEIVLLIGEL